MQVSIYLPGPLMRRLDRQARRGGASRSRYIQSILEKALSGKAAPGPFDEIFGVLDAKEAEDLLGTLRSSRRNSARFS
ncbi:MAG: ribbon-helix-helix protein, CopG family [Deltaproteobacteria bacterium]|nr:ribbon-helix-helix protein, CopG family [Deltaproteobacteria bacterium]